MKCSLINAGVSKVFQQRRKHLIRMRSFYGVLHSIRAGKIPRKVVRKSHRTFATEKYIAIHLRRPQGASSMGTRWYGRMTSWPMPNIAEETRSCAKCTASFSSAAQSIVDHREVVTFSSPCFLSCIASG